MQTKQIPDIMCVFAFDICKCHIISNCHCHCHCHLSLTECLKIVFTPILHKQANRITFVVDSMFSISPYKYNIFCLSPPPLDPISSTRWPMASKNQSNWYPILWQTHCMDEWFIMQWQSNRNQAITISTCYLTLQMSVYQTQIGFICSCGCVRSIKGSVIRLTGSYQFDAIQLIAYYQLKKFTRTARTLPCVHWLLLSCLYMHRVLCLCAC